MKRGITLAIAALALAAAAACSSDSTPPPAVAGPEEALQEFYRSLNDGDYAGAMALYGTAALDVWQDPQLAAPDSFEKWATAHTKGGQVNRVSVIQESPADAGTKLEYEVVYSDGTSVRHHVELIQEEGRWKMGLIG